MTPDIVLAQSEDVKDDSYAQALIEEDLLEEKLAQLKKDIATEGNPTISLILEEP